MSAGSKNWEKFTKNHLLGVQAPFKVIDVDKSKKPVTMLVMISSMSVFICKCFHTIRANNGKITFLWGYPFLMPSFAGNPRIHTHEILSR